MVHPSVRKMLECRDAVVLLQDILYHMPACSSTNSQDAQPIARETQDIARLVGPTVHESTAWNTHETRHSHGA